MLDELYNRISIRSKCIISISRGVVAAQDGGLAGCGTKALSVLSSHRPSQKALQLPTRLSFLFSSSTFLQLHKTLHPHPRLSSPRPLHIKDFSLPLIPITLKLNHKENYVSQRRHHALRDRLLIRHSGSRPCLRIREVPSTLLLLPIHGSSFRFSLPTATSAATTLIPFDRSSCQPCTRCNPSCPPFIVGSNAFSSPSVFPRERQNTTHNTPPPSLSSPTVTPSSSSSWLPLHFFENPLV